MKKIKKRHITLIEIMIVIMLISLIGGVLGVNLKGSLDRGRAFKTEQAISQLDDILQLESAKGTRTNKQIADDPLTVLNEAGIMKKPEEILKDGWNIKLKIIPSRDGFTITSKRYDRYRKDHNLDNCETVSPDADDDVLDDAGNDAPQP